MNTLENIEKWDDSNINSLHISFFRTVSDIKEALDEVFTKIKDKNVSLSYRLLEVYQPILDGNDLSENSLPYPIRKLLSQGIA